MDEIEIQEDQEIIEPKRKLSPEKHRLLLFYIPAILFVFFLASAILDERSPFLGVIEVVFGFSLNVAMFSWIRTDSRERGYELHRSFTLVVVLLGIFALLYYLFRSRGFVGGIKATGLMLLYALVCFVALGLVVIVIMTTLMYFGVLALPADI